MYSGVEWENDVGEAWLTAEEAAARLGVKPQTLYAYASRGQLRRRRSADGRRSEYHGGDLAALAERGRRRSGTVLPEIRSAITEIDPERGPRYRERLTLELAGSATYEQVATLLWTGDLPSPPGPPCQATTAQVAAARAAVRAAAPDAPAADCLPLIVAAAAVVDPLRRDRSPGAVATAGRAILGTMAAALPGAPSEAPEQSLASRLVAAVGRKPASGMVRAVDAALVLLADHELAASTLAARAAASAEGDPYAVVLAGLAVVSGARHGAASTAVESALRSVQDGVAPLVALASSTATSASPPGFGHLVYEGPDPRGQRLLEILEQEGLGTPEAQEQLLDAAAERGLPPPNIDLALAALTVRAGLPPGTGELLFAIARTAGWIAHALEQYQEPSLLRPRAVPVTR